jgi:hypothetical protein
VSAPAAEPRDRHGAALTPRHDSRRTGVSSQEAAQNRMDVEAIDSPLGQGETQDWMTWRRHDQK